MCSKQPERSIQPCAVCSHSTCQMHAVPFVGLLVADRAVCGAFLHSQSMYLTSPFEDSALLLRPRMTPCAPPPTSVRRHQAFVNSNASSKVRKKPCGKPGGTDIKFISPRCFFCERTTSALRRCEQDTAAVETLTEPSCCCTTACVALDEACDTGAGAAADTDAAACAAADAAAALMRVCEPAAASVVEPTGSETAACQVKIGCSGAVCVGCSCFVLFGAFSLSRRV